MYGHEVSQLIILCFNTGNFSDMEGLLKELAALSYEDARLTWLKNRVYLEERRDAQKVRYVLLMGRRTGATPPGTSGIPSLRHRK